MKSIKDALQQAFANAGVAVPVAPQRRNKRCAPSCPMRTKVVLGRKGDPVSVGQNNKDEKMAKTASPRPTSSTRHLLQQAVAARRLKNQGYHFTPSWERGDSRDGGREALCSVKAGRGHKDIAMRAPRFQLEVAENAKLMLRPDHMTLSGVDETLQQVGFAEQCSTEAERCDASDERELVMGLDFGSSCTKVVISDAASGKSYAVSFGADTGIASYLLPSVLRSNGGTYSLAGEGNLLQGLKSSLTDAQGHAEMLRVTAFLSLVIRQARGWFFKSYRDLYRDVTILWSLRIGMPREQDRRSNDEVRAMYLRMGQAAWAVAGHDAPVCVTGVMDALSRSNVDVDCDVSVVAEIAAEIFGFVTSDAFDTKGRNIYLMADVGGDTLDVSLFHVHRGKHGWTFSYFTSIVARLGVKQLARHRLAWWRNTLAGASRYAPLLDSLEKHQQAFVIGSRIPDRFEDYFRGVSIKRLDDWRSPDDDHAARIRRLVRQDAYQRAIRKKMIPQRQMDGIPMFVCGGGARMEFYSVIEKAMQPQKSSPLHAKRRHLVRPQDLTCPGLADRDYDRLAVAYGLSKIKIKTELDAAPITELEPPADMTDVGYVSKDLC